MSVPEKGESQTCPRRGSELERAREGGVCGPEKGERRGWFGGRVCEVLGARVGTRGRSKDRRRRNRIHTGKEGTRQYKTNSRRKTIQTLSEVAHKNRENHFARRTQVIPLCDPASNLWIGKKDGGTWHPTSGKLRDLPTNTNLPLGRWKSSPYR